MSTLIFLHGALGSSSQFKTICERLQNQYTCLAPDFPLHGNNATDISFTIKDFANYLIQFIEGNCAEKVSVFGYSMGGYIALYAASLRPELFENIMTLATKFNWSQEIAEKEKAMLNSDIMEAKIPMFVEQLKSTHLHIDWKLFVNKTATLLESLGQNPLLTNEVLKSLVIKANIGIGDKDNMVTLEETIQAYRQMNEASLYVLPNTKHPFEKVNEELLLANIQQFMKK